MFRAPESCEASGQALLYFLNVLYVLRTYRHSCGEGRRHLVVGGEVGDRGADVTPSLCSSTFKTGGCFVVVCRPSVQHPCQRGLSWPLQTSTRRLSTDPAEGLDAAWPWVKIAGAQSFHIRRGCSSTCSASVVPQPLHLTTNQKLHAYSRRARHCLSRRYRFKNTCCALRFHRPSLLVKN